MNVMGLFVAATLGKREGAGVRVGITGWKEVKGRWYPYGNAKVVSRWSQGGHKVVALSQGCFKLVTTLYKIPRLAQVLSQGCHKVVKWL